MNTTIKKIDFLKPSLGFSTKYAQIPKKTGKLNQPVRDPLLSDK
jgi:hypothetical protein